MFIILGIPSKTNMVILLICCYCRRVQLAFRRRDPYRNQQSECRLFSFLGTLACTLPSKSEGLKMGALVVTRQTIYLMALTLVGVCIGATWYFVIAPLISQRAVARKWTALARV